MATLNAPQTATVTVTQPNGWVTVTCAQGDEMQVSWVSPGSVSGQRTVKNITEDVGPFADQTVITLRAVSGAPQYEGPNGGGFTAAQVAALVPSVTVGAWRGIPSVTMRLRMAGSGTVTMDSATGEAGTGTVTLGVFTYTVSGSEVTEYAYPGDNARSIRINTTGTAAVEVV